MSANTLGRMLVAVAFCFASTSTSFASYVDDCVANNVPIVRIGAPHAYKPIADAFTDQAVMQPGSIPWWSTCPVWAFGTDYQIVDWIENAELDAGIVSEFAARLMDIESDGVSLYAATNEWPAATGGLRSHEYWLTAVGASGTAAVLDQFINDAINGIEPSVAKIFVDSHLSTDFVLLLDHIEARAATLGFDLAETGDALWTAVLDRLEFKLGLHPDTGGPGVVSLLVANQSSADAVRLGAPNSPSSDLLVFDTSLEEQLFGVSFDAYKFDEYLSDWHELFHPPDDSERSGVLERYVDKNYRIVDAGFHRHRLFQFNLNEASRVLHATNAGPTALVLTGGGVKAAYQTRLIDHLYGNGLFSNIPQESPAGTANTAVIKYVIGTSGGALLGTFVSAIDNADDLNLTDQLWKRENGSRYVKADDIFPILDMPRYLSLIIGAVVLVLLVRAVSNARAFWKWYRSGKSTRETPVEKHYVSRAIAMLILLLILGVMPFAVKYVVGRAALEHVPWITGVAYLVCLLIAGIAYRRVVPDAATAIRDFWPRGISFAMFGLGLLAIAASIAYRYRDYASDDAAHNAPLWVLISCCAGFILIVLAFARVLSTQIGSVAKVDGKVVAVGFGVFAGVPILATVILYLSGTTLFELTAAFWQSFLAWCAALTAVLLLLACSNIAPRIKRFLRPAVDFLAGDVGEGTKQFAPQRRGSVIYIFLAGFVWWNLVLAPGLYGNETALKLFADVYCNGLERVDCGAADIDDMPSIQPVTPFVISATALGKESERYFVLHRDAYGDECVDGLMLRNNPILNRVFRTDPRWHQFRCNPTAGTVIEKVFASGSPFPVFPATRVLLDDADEYEWLVDGGFAHNIPMEAASKLGATSIVVLSSSPLAAHSSGRGELQPRWFGNLIANFNRLFPYLFERSQVEDAIRARDAVVIAMAPTFRAEDRPGEDGWPPLTDFRGVTVERMIREGERDIDQRLAVIESWGRPVCKIGGIAWHCDDLVLQR